MYLLLRADQRPKQNHEDVLLPAHLQELYLSVKDLGLILRQKLIRISLTLLRHGHLTREEDGAIESWRLKDYLRNEVEYSQHCSDECGRVQWQEAEATRKYFNTVLTRQEKKFFTSELFKVIQDAIPLIFPYRTMCLFRTISSNSFIILDVESILHSITNSGLIPGGPKFEQKIDGVLYSCGSYV